MIQIARHSKAKHCRRGLTLIELLLALSITVIIGAAAISMLSAAAYGTSSSRELRSVASGAMALEARLADLIGHSEMVLTANDTMLILWVKDRDLNGTPSLYELCVIEFDTSDESGRGSLSIYENPSPPIADFDYQYDANFTTITNGLRSVGIYEKTKLKTDIASVKFELDHVDPQQALLVGYHIELRAGDTTQPIVSAVALRN